MERMFREANGYIGSLKTNSEFQKADVFGRRVRRMRGYVTLKNIQNSSEKNLVRCR